MTKSDTAVALSRRQMLAAGGAAIEHQAQR